MISLMFILALLYSYADDLQLIIDTTRENSAGCITLLNNDLASISDWTINSGLILNPAIEDTCN